MSHRSYKVGLAFPFVVLAAFAALPGLVATGFAASACSLYASASGSDSGSGSQASPFRTAQKLVSSLTPGQTGCLTGGGSFAGDVTFSAGGSSGAPVTLTSDPAAGRATIRGAIYVSPSASYVTIDNVKIDATGAGQMVAVQLFADYGRLLNSEVYGADQDRIGVQVGYQKTVKNVEIAGNRIHDFGISGIYNHGIYVDLADGALVHDNYIYDNAGGYGIQLWTHSMNGRFYRNTIDGNGAGSIIVAGQSNANGGPSSNNEIDHNVLSNPTSGQNITIYWSSGGPQGTGNTVHDNVYWKGGLDQGNSYCSGSCSGVVYSSNLSVDPTYVNRSGKDFTLQTGSPALGYGVAAAAAPPAAAAPTGGSSPPSTPTNLAKAGATTSSIAVSWTGRRTTSGWRAMAFVRRGCGGGSTSLTSSTFDGLACGTSYTLAVDAAYDDAGNRSGKASLSAATVACPPPAPSGPVAAYALDAGSGASVADNSGNGNTGTIVGAAWTSAGKFGAALSFNGSNSEVTVPDSAKLDLTGGMTLEAWVKPDTLGFWKTVIVKEQTGDLVYGLFADSDSAVPTGRCIRVGSRSSWQLAGTDGRLDASGDDL